MSTFDTYRKRSPVGFWTITWAVCLGILAANTIELIATAAMARISLQLMAFEIDKSTKAARAAEAQRAATAERNKQQALAEEAERQRAIAEEERQRELADAKKKAAWAKFYKRDPACDDNPNTETFTRCANDHLRAKTQFEATYTP